MADMVSLKRAVQKQECSGIALEEAEYEWGTTLHLEGDVAKRLGLEGIAAGEKVQLSGLGYIKSVSINDDKNGKTVSVSIQVTDLAVERVQQIDQANVLYGQQG